MSKNKTTYYGWENVPPNTLVKTKSADKSRREFYVKDSRDYPELPWFMWKPKYPNTSKINESLPICESHFPPDEYTTKKYVEVR